MAIKRQRVLLDWIKHDAKTPTISAKDLEIMFADALADAKGADEDGGCCISMEREDYTNGTFIYDVTFRVWVPGHGGNDGRA